MEVLLTNDDGIDAPGLQALYDVLGDLGTVTVVAPLEDKSAVGRAMSNEVRVDAHDLGYAVHGTPADCVVAGIGALGLDPDLVVAGCNKGANLGEYGLGRSGTVSAAVEAAFFGVPAIAVSLYVPGGDISFRDFTPTTSDLAVATRATHYLAEHALPAGVFDQADYLNVNAPLSDRACGDGENDHPPMEVTRPSHAYDMDAERNGATITIYDRVWDRMRHGEIPDPEGSDRRAVLEGRISVSPLLAPHSTQHHEALDGLAETYPG